jgi:peptidoglycan hydrolase-like protein with peptidoglycan-binding domain
MQLPDSLILQNKKSMKLKNIQQKLNELGYYTWQSAYLYVVRKMSDEDPRIVEPKDFFCVITLEQNQIKLSEPRTQIIEWEYFDSEAEVIAYVKDKFPL